jgi:hypothetical protein
VLPYDEEDWRDALVLVRQGEVVLDTRCGRSFFFERGTVLWLAELPLASLRNRGREPAVLVSAARPAELR